MDPQPSHLSECLHVGGGFSPGSLVVILAPAWPTPLGKIATPICFDNDYSAVPREAIVNGAELLLIPSMDAQHWTARQHLQHAELFRHRAAENGRWLVVAASSGLTQVIDPSGRRIDSLPLFQPGVLNGDVATQAALTIYTRFGWLIGPICSGMAVLTTIAAFVIQRRDQRIATLEEQTSLPRIQPYFDHIFG